MEQSLSVSSKFDLPFRTAASPAQRKSAINSDHEISLLFQSTISSHNETVAVTNKRRDCILSLTPAAVLDSLLKFAFRLTVEAVP